MAWMNTDTDTNLKTLICYDHSGSTSGCAIYHQITQQIVQSIPGRNKIRVFLWDSNLKESNLEELKKINQSQRGSGGTSPNLIAQALARERDKKCNLIVISDGQVGTSDVDAAERDMAKVPRDKLAQVQVHLIGHSVNMSVSCAFTRNSPSQVFVYDANGNVDRNASTFVTEEDLNLLEKLDELREIDEVEQKLPAIERAVTARVMGTSGDRMLADALIDMRRRVVASLAKQQAKLPSAQELVQHVRANNLDQAVEACRRVNADYFTPELSEMTLDKRISKLVSMCEGSLRTVFTTQGVRQLRMERAHQQQQVETEQVDETNNASKFTCPLTLDEENDAVLLFALPQDGDLLSTIEVGIVDQCITCPLAALRFPQLVDRIVDCIDHVVSLKSIHESMRAGVPFLAQSPFTRRDVVGGLCLGSNLEHVKATDWTIAKALTGPQAKVIGNMDLWFAVIYFAMEQHWDAKFERLGDAVRQQLRNHMYWRLRHRQSFASLSGQSQFVMTRLPLDIACWFTLSSAATYAREIDVPSSTDPVRAHIYHYEYLVKLCTLSKLRLPFGVTRYCERLKVLLSMLSWTKRDDATFRELIRALHQNVIEVGTVDDMVASREQYVPKRFVFVDGEPKLDMVRRVGSDLPFFYRMIPVPDLVAMAKMVNASQSAVDVALPFAMPPAEPVEAKQEWLTDLAVMDFAVEICPGTMRPWAKSPKTGLTWQEAAFKRFGKADLLSTYKWFEDYVFKYNAFPVNADSFLVYMYNRLCICVDKHTTMPETALVQAEQTLMDYAKVGCGTTVTVQMYKKLSAESRPIPRRMEMEADYLKG